MKFTLHKLKIGDQVWAQVVEHVSSEEFIVSFHGDLIRVRNESLKAFALDEKVLVKVTAVNPLSFQLLPLGDCREATRLNVSV
jgi:hypothetical protein